MELRHANSRSSARRLCPRASSSAGTDPAGLCGLAPSTTRRSDNAGSAGNKVKKAESVRVESQQSNRLYERLIPFLFLSEVCTSKLHEGGLGTMRTRRDHASDVQRETVRSVHFYCPRYPAFKASLATQNVLKSPLPVKTRPCRFNLEPRVSLHAGHSRKVFHSAD